MKKTYLKYCMNEKSAYLCIRFREGKWLSDDMMNESGSESRISQVSYLAMAQGSEKSFPETFLKNFFSKKISKKICTVKINHLPLHPLSLQNGKPSSLKDFR